MQCMDELIKFANTDEAARNAIEYFKWNQAHLMVQSKFRVKLNSPPVCKCALKISATRKINNLGKQYSMLNEQWS